MSDIDKSHSDQLARIKKRVQNAHDYSKDNYKRFNDCRRFVFESSLNENEVNLLKGMNRPQLTFNRLEAYISRLLGEFSKQEPDIAVNAFDEDDADPAVIKVVEMHLKHVFSDDINENLRYAVYKDLLSGGFSAVKVLTDYEHAMSMHQTIRFQRCEPTLTGFDMLARLPSKGDGQFCFELFPKSKEQFEEEYPDVDTKSLSFKRTFSGFHWSYVNDKTPTIMVCDYYEKKSKQEKIVQVSNGKVMTMKQYKKLVDEWDDITMPPAIVGEPRKTTLEHIVRYRMIEDKVIEYEETDFEMLPIVFIDGNSLMLSTNENGNVKQMTRPYVYHAMDMQRFIDYAGNAWAYELQNTLSHKIMVAKEALPKEEDFLHAYKDIQNASTLVFNSVHENDPSLPIMNPIREVMRVPMPPEISGAFMAADSVIQGILGSYDASLGINDNQLSGVAIVEAASQSNAAAMPYIVGCLQGMQRLAEIYVNMMPKVLILPRNIGIIDEEGQRQHVKINGDEGMPMDFETKALNVSLKAGASFQVQKSRTMNTIKELMGVSQQFAEFINMKGLGFLLDNVDGKGIEELKALTQEWQQQMEAEKQQAMQMAQQESQQNSGQEKVQVEMAKLQQKAQNDEAKIAIEEEKLQIEREKLQVNAELTDKSLKVQMIKAAMDRQFKESDLHVKKVDVAHGHLHNHSKLNHDMLKHVMTLSKPAKA